MRSGIVNGQWKGVLKSILRGDKCKTIAKKIFSIASQRKDLCLLVTELAVKESRNICKLNNRSILRQVSGDNLCNVDAKKIVEEFKSRCSILHGLLSSVMGNASVLRQAVAVAVILFARNNHLSAFHHALGQILDQGGATDEVWEMADFLHHISEAAFLHHKSLAVFLHHNSVAVSLVHS